MDTLSFQSPAIGLRQSYASNLTVPLYLYATVFSSLCVAVGINWDISWHMTIGRDGLLSPPHLAVYLGAIVSGGFSAFEVFRISFWGSQVEKAASVRFWHWFYGSLGAMFCIFGALAMLTSAPFDDWWHNTYGLDVTILSPPHSVLALGIAMVQVGAIVSVLPMMNRSAGASERQSLVLKALFVISAGLLIVMVFTLISQYMRRGQMHNVFFYQLNAAVFPLFMVAVSKAYPGKYGATLMTLVYTVFLLLMAWILPLFPAEPLLGPILTPVTHFQAFEFPLLLIVPALALDMTFNASHARNSWIRAALLAIAFVLPFFAVQWPFADFLMAEAARNWFFAQNSWIYSVPENATYRFQFAPWNVSSGMGLVKGLGIAVLIGLLSARLGLAWGHWMKSIQR